MIRVIVLVVHRYSLLPHFMRYYSSLGVDEFAVGCTRQNYESIREILNDYPASLYPVDDLPMPARFELGLGLEALRNAIGWPASEWHIPADLDEFHQFPEDLRDLVKFMERSDLHLLGGSFSDRVAPDGSLPAVQPTPSIWRQCPLEADITQRLVRGNCNKVVLCRGSVVLAVGHHHSDSHGVTRWDAVVHHFKWRKGVLEILRQRMETYREKAVEFWVESDRVLRYFENTDRFNLCDFTWKLGWIPPGF